MEHPALVGVHGLKGAGTAGGPYLIGYPLCKAGKGFLPLLPVSLGIYGYAGVAVLLAVAVHRKAGQVLHGVQSLSPVAYEHAHGGLIDVQADAILAYVCQHCTVHVHALQQAFHEIRRLIALRRFLGEALRGLLGLIAGTVVTVAAAAAPPVPAFPALGGLLAYGLSRCFVCLVLLGDPLCYGSLTAAFFPILTQPTVPAAPPVPIVLPRLPAVTALPAFPLLIFGPEIFGQRYILRLPLYELYYGGLGAYAQYALAFMLYYVYLHLVYGDLQLLQAFEDGFID